MPTFIASSPPAYSSFPYPNLPQCPHYGPYDTDNIHNPTIPASHDTLSNQDGQWSASEVAHYTNEEPVYPTTTTQSFSEGRHAGNPSFSSVDTTAYSWNILDLDMAAVVNPCFSFENTRHHEVHIHQSPSSGYSQPYHSPARSGSSPPIYTNASSYSDCSSDNTPLFATMSLSPGSLSLECDPYLYFISRNIPSNPSYTPPETSTSSNVSNLSHNMYHENRPLFSGAHLTHTDIWHQSTTAGASTDESSPLGFSPPFSSGFSQDSHPAITQEPIHGSFKGFNSDTMENFYLPHNADAGVPWFGEHTGQDQTGHELPASEHNFMYSSSDLEGGGPPSVPRPVDQPPVFYMRGDLPRPDSPIPVPNLTKKSRGRRVPTKPLDDSRHSDGMFKKGRQFVCNIKGCNKYFVRAEHLQRHVKCIHTNHKPFMCPHPGCGKGFNRYDNLGQHIRVHKNFKMFIHHTVVSP